MDSFWSTYYHTTHGDNPLTSEPSTFTLFCSPYLLGGERVVEFGCGNGRDAAFFNARGLRYTGVDACPEAIKRCEQRRLPSCRFVNASFTDEHLPETLAAAADVVYSRFTLHSVSAEGERAAFDIARRLLRPAGLLLVEARSVNDPRYGSGERVAEHAFRDTHFRRFLHLGDTVARLEAAGFEVASASEETRAANFAADKAVVVRIVARRC